MEAAVETRVATAITGRQAKVLQVKPEGQKTACILSEGGRVLVSNILASHIRPGDEIDFPLALESTGTEIYVRRTRLRDAPTISTTLRSATPPNPGATSVSSSMFVPKYRKDAWASV